MKTENLIVEFYNGMKRKVRVLLPEDYKTSGNTYPALYMFDGQNVISPRESYTGTTWGVKEALEDLQKKGIVQPMIIIAIDHAEEMRLSEYSPFNLDLKGHKIEGEGAIFSDFLVKKLIPWLEEKYPLESDPSARALAGSSMGGLITAYTAMKHPHVFSAFGVFSLCSWVGREKFMSFVKANSVNSGCRFFVQVGTREGFNAETGQEDGEVSQNYLKDSLEFVDALREKGVQPNNIHFIQGQGDWHSEEVWRKYMPEFLLWLKNEEIDLQQAL